MMAIDSRIPEKPSKFDDEDIVSDDGRIWSYSIFSLIHLNWASLFQKNKNRNTFSPVFFCICMLNGYKNCLLDV